MDVSCGILSSNDLVDLCTAWRKGIMRVWGVPPDTHCDVLPLLCKRLPVYGEICIRTANFVRACLLYNTSVVRNVAVVVFSRRGVNLPLVGMLCTLCFVTTLDCLIYHRRR